MNAETPFAPGVSGSVRAKRRNVPAKRAVVIHCFVPEIVQPSSVRRGARPQRARIRSGFGLGEREGAEHLPAGQRRHEARALLVGAEVEDRKRDGARVHGHRDADARVGARELLEHEDVGEEVRARSAVLLRDADAHQAELGELPEELLREAVLAVPLGRVRLDLGVRELARQRLDLPLVRGQLEVHAASIWLSNYDMSVIESRAYMLCSFMGSADLLRTARLRAGLTQDELGRAVGRPQSAIARWEGGRVQPSLETLRELIRACRLS